MISRVKVMGKMDIAERRIPQDGRSTIKIGDTEVDVRISSVPTNHGERIVMRLLDKSTNVYKLGEIGLSDLAILLANYPTVSGANPEDGDLNGDGAIDLSDLAALLSVYGTTCP